MTSWNLGGAAARRSTFAEESPVAATISASTTTPSAAKPAASVSATPAVSKPAEAPATTAAAAKPAAVSGSPPPQPSAANVKPAAPAVAAATTVSAPSSGALKPATSAGGASALSPSPRSTAPAAASTAVGAKPAAVLSPAAPKDGPKPAFPAPRPKSGHFVKPLDLRADGYITAPAEGSPTSSRFVPTLRGKKPVTSMIEVWKGKMLQNKEKADLAEEGGYHGLLTLASHNAQDVANLASEAILALNRLPSGGIGIVDKDKLSPLCKLFFETQNAFVKENVLWDLATLAAVPESQSVVVEKFGIDVTVKLVNHPNNEIAAAAVTLIGNLGLDDFYTNTIMEEHGFDQVMKLVKDRKDVKVTCAVAFALGNFARKEVWALKVDSAGLLSWAITLLASNDPDVLRTAAGAIAAFAAHPPLRKKLLDENALKLLVVLMKSTRDALTLLHTSQAIATLMSEHRAFPGGTLPEQLIALDGLSVLSHVATNVPDWLQIKEQGHLVRRVPPQVPNIILRIVTAFRNMAQDTEKTKDLMRKHEPTVETLRTQERSDTDQIAKTAEEALMLLGLIKRRPTEAELEAERARELMERKAKEEAERRLKEEAERKAKEEEERKKRELAALEAERKRAEEERKRLEEERKKREEEARQRAAEEERQKKQLEAERARLEEERKRLEEERKARWEEEKRKLEEERRKFEEEARRRREEEERRRKEEEERRRKEEEERRRKEEEERRAREQREEEERRERLKREEEDRRRIEEELKKLEREREALAEARRAAERAREKEKALTLTDEQSAERERDTAMEIDQQVALFLTHLGLERYIPHFAHNDIAYWELFSLRDKELRQMGIRPLGPRLKILDAISTLLPPTDGKALDEELRELLGHLQSRDPLEKHEALKKLAQKAERSSKARQALLRLRLIPVLIKLIRSTRFAEIQTAALRVLAALTKEDGARVEVREADGLEPLTYLVEARAFSEDPAALASVLTCIRNCIKDEKNLSIVRADMIGPNLIDIAKTRIEVVAPLALEILSVLAEDNNAVQDSIYYYYGSLDVLVSLLDSTDVAMQEMATRALGSLASLNHRSWQYLIHGHKAKVYHQIQDFLDAEQGANDGLQGAACLAIAYFVENEAPLQHEAIASGAIRRLFQHLSSRSERVQADACKAVRVLVRGRATHQNIMRVMMEGLAVGGLCDLARYSKNIQVRSEAMGALFEIASHSSSYAELIFSSLGPEPILKGMQSDSPSLRYNSCGVMWHAIKNNPEYRREFEYFKYEPTLQALLNSTDPETRYGAHAINAKFFRDQNPDPVQALWDHIPK